MAEYTDINPAIVDSLYREAIDLADEARHLFDGPESARETRMMSDQTHIALSCEALRTTTRMMHAIAWLLNHKAHHNGEMSQFALRRQGRLPNSETQDSQDRLALLDEDVCDLIGRTKNFYARIQRLDAGWREGFAQQTSAVHRLRERIGASLASQ